MKIKLILLFVLFSFISVSKVFCNYNENKDEISLKRKLALDAASVTFSGDILNNIVKEDLKLVEAMKIIINRDIEGLKKVCPEVLNDKFKLYIDGDKLKNNLDGRLSIYGISGENILFFVLFNSAANRTDEDNIATLEMLKIIIKKGVNLDSVAVDVCINQQGEIIMDYFGKYSLLEFARFYSFPAAVELLRENGATEWVKGN